MTNMTQPARPRVIIGVDTHLQVHVAVAVNHLGARLGQICIRTDRVGYGELLSWAQSHGEIQAVGIEGAGSYGAGLARWLGAQGVTTIEVDRPDRRTRAAEGKSDPLDAESAARAVLSGRARAVPKAGDDQVETIRMLRVARAGAIKARTAAINQLRALAVTAPDSLSEELKALASSELVARVIRFRPGPLVDTTAGAKAAMVCVARRIRHLDAELEALDGDLEALVGSAAPELVSIYGVGPDCAGALLVAAGDNPDRLRSEAAMAKAWGVAPLPATSGKTTNRHRVNPGGNRQANAALFRIVLVRMRHHGPTRAYVERRTKEGLSKREIIRCLKRYLVREVYAALTASGRLPALQGA